MRWGGFDTDKFLDFEEGGLAVVGWDASCCEGGVLESLNYVEVSYRERVCEEKFSILQRCSFFDSGFGFGVAVESKGGGVFAVELQREEGVEEVLCFKVGELSWAAGLSVICAHLVF